MSGYRQDGFDPNAYEQPGPPLRPFDRLQWLGVGLGVVGTLLILANLADQFELIAADVPYGAGLLLALGGAFLINSRRNAPAGDRQPGSTVVPYRLAGLLLAGLGFALGLFAALNSKGVI